MFKHVLIPTDGSSLSKKAVKAGIAFAKEFGATVGARGLQGLSAVVDAADVAGLARKVARVEPLICVKG